MASYKSKYQAIKIQYESLKEAYDKVEKMAVNSDKELQRKNTYINTMRQKY